MRSGSGYNKIENEYIFQITISNLQISANMLWDDIGFIITSTAPKLGWWREFLWKHSKLFEHKYVNVSIHKNANFYQVGI